jgi:hypothetical protein
MKEFEIYLQDLTPQAQERLAQYVDLSETNYDTFPLATVPFYEEGEV